MSVKNGYYTDGFFTNGSAGSITTEVSWPASKRGYVVGSTYWFDTIVSYAQMSNTLTRYVTKPVDDTRLYGYTQAGEATLFTGIHLNKYYQNGELFTGFAAPPTNSSTFGGRAWELSTSLDGGRFQLLVAGVPYTGLITIGAATSNPAILWTVSQDSSRFTSPVYNVGGLPTVAAHNPDWYVNQTSAEWSILTSGTTYWKNGRAGTGSAAGLFYSLGKPAGSVQYDEIVGGRCFRNGVLLNGPSYEAPAQAEGPFITRMFRSGNLYTGVFYGIDSASPSNWVPYFTANEVIRQDPVTLTNHQVFLPRGEAGYHQGKIISTANGYTRPIALKGTDNVTRLYIGDEGGRASGVYDNRYYANGSIAQGYYMVGSGGNALVAEALAHTNAPWAARVFLNGSRFTGVLTETNAHAARDNTNTLLGTSLVAPIYGIQYLRGGVCHGVYNGRYYHHGYLDTAGTLRTVYYYNGLLAHNMTDSLSGPTFVYGNGVEGQSWEMPA